VPVWGWIIIAAIVLIAVGVPGWALWSARRTSRLQDRFGPEYQRVTAGDHRSGEAELAQRMKRREKLDIHPIPVAMAERYLTQWREIQMRFVERPGLAVVDADRLVTALMQERGYPMEKFEQRAADISVDHADVVEAYRMAHGVATSPEPATDQLRSAMLRYRQLFERLLETSADPAVTSERDRSVR